MWLLFSKAMMVTVRTLKILFKLYDITLDEKFYELN